jgi:general nucleoside transport system permease protein
MYELLHGVISMTFLHSVIASMTPLVIGGQGELLIERSGILNLAIAGMFPLAGASAFVVSFAVGPGAAGMILGFLAGAGSAAAIGVLLGVFFLSLRANQVTVGLAFFMFTLGGAMMLYRIAVGTTIETKSVLVLSQLRIPGLSSVPFLGPVFFSHNVLVYVGLIITPIMAYFLFHTPVGLRLRAVGENPRCVDGLGLSVSRIRYTSLAVGSALIGVAGAFFPLVQLGSFNSQTLAGQGWLALMLVIFGKWRPWRVFFGAVLFAYVLALQYSVALSLPGVPVQLFLALPYVLAVLVLVRTSGRAGGPAALALPYNREGRM